MRCPDVVLAPADILVATILVEIDVPFPPPYLYSVNETFRLEDRGLIFIYMLFELSNPPIEGAHVVTKASMTVFTKTGTPEDVCFTIQKGDLIDESPLIVPHVDKLYTDGDVDNDLNSRNGKLTMLRLSG